MSKRKIIYSALVGAYDEIPNNPCKVEEGWELILFTDQTTEAYVNGWKIMPLLHVIPDDNVRTNRWHKINAHLIFDDCLCSVYIDCNILIKDDFVFRRTEELIEQNIMLALIAHPSRTCVYDEVKACLSFGKDLKSKLDENVAFLKRENYPENNGMFENNLIYRNHTIEKIKEVNELWWSILATMARRDQLSLVYVLWKLNVTPEYFLKTPKKTLRNHESFVYITKHKINNNKFEFTELELNEIKEKHAQKYQEKINEIKRSISYKVFYKIEVKIQSFFNKK